MADNAINRNKYIRLILLASVDLVVGLPLNTYLFFSGVFEMAKQPYNDWEWMHSVYHVIKKFPFLLWSQDRQTSINLRLQEFIPVFCAVVFFSFFCTTSDTVTKLYRLCPSRLSSRLSRSKGTTTAISTSMQFGSTGFDDCSVDGSS